MPDISSAVTRPCDAGLGARATLDHQRHRLGGIGRGMSDAIEVRQSDELFCLFLCSMQPLIPVRRFDRNAMDDGVNAIQLLFSRNGAAAAMTLCRRHTMYTSSTQVDRATSRTALRPVPSVEVG